VAETDTLRRLVRHSTEELEALAANGTRPDLRGVSVVAASGDVHEYGLYVLVAVLRDLGASVVDLGTSVEPELVIQAAAETAADAVAYSTYNGMALRVCRERRSPLQGRRLPTQLFIGGRLTEDLDGAKSVDVTRDLEQLGAIPCARVEEMVAGLSARTEREGG
jgi:methylmalonyl-CoA mutase cobalamin-binding subunit